MQPLARPNVFEYLQSVGKPQYRLLPVPSSSWCVHVHVAAVPVGLVELFVQRPAWYQVSLPQPKGGCVPIDGDGLVLRVVLDAPAADDAPVDAQRPRYTQPSTDTGKYTQGAPLALGSTQGDSPQRRHRRLEHVAVEWHLRHTAHHALHSRSPGRSAS